MRNITWLWMVLVVGFVLLPDGALAKDKKPGGGKKKAKAEVVTDLGTMTITGTIKADGENAKLIADDNTEYILGIATALANKDKNDQKVTITGTVTQIGKDKWLSASAPAIDNVNKPAPPKAEK